MLLMLSWRISCSLMIVLPLSLGAQAQSGDWIRVQNLAPGTPISVKAKLRHLCTFEGATNTMLVCGPKLTGPSTLTLSFERKEVRQVRLEHSDDTNALIGLGTGSAIGFAIGASGHRVDTSARLVGGVVGGAVGAFAGRFMNRSIPITHKNVIYKRK